MSKKLLYFSGAIYSGRHIEGVKVFFLLFRDVTTAAELNKYENGWSELSPIEQIFDYYSKDADILWLQDEKRITPISDSFETIKLHYDNLDQSLSFEEKNKIILAKFNPENPQLISSNQKLKH